MKKKLIIALLVSLVCVAAASGTIAWLANFSEAANTFTVGRIGIMLTEPSWPSADTAQKVYPGAVIDKDPTVTVEAKSEDCFVYVMIENELNEAVQNAVALDIDTNNWEQISTSGSRTLYRYNGIVSFNEAPRRLEAVFTNVTVNENTVTEANIDLLDGRQIRVKAYAHQSGAASQDDVDLKAAAFFEMV